MAAESRSVLYGRRTLLSSNTDSLDFPGCLRPLCMALAISSMASSFFLRLLSLLCIDVVLNPRDGHVVHGRSGSFGSTGHCRVRMRSALIANPKSELPVKT